MCACIDDTDGSLLYGFNLVCLRFGNQVMPDWGCVFVERMYVFGAVAMYSLYLSLLLHVIFNKFYIP